MATEGPPPEKVVDPVKKLAEEITRREKVVLTPQIDTASQELFWKFDYQSVSLIDRGAFKEALREMTKKPEKMDAEGEQELSALAKTIFDAWDFNQDNLYDL